MKTLGLMSLLVVLAATASAQHGHMEAGHVAPAPALPGVGNLHHPVSTHNAEAQRFFDQGLNLSFAFNHDEAFRAFQRAAELDPGLTMAYWGQALVLGPNINLPMDEDRGKRAYELVQKALALSKDALEDERAYVAALAKRYAADPKADRAALDLAYKNAMSELVKQYPDDLDAATLFAEAAMDLRPWQYWMPDGKPNQGTEEIVAVLESVLRRDPNHIGAIHLYIHSVEASPRPERALGYAERLGKLAPGAGHLVHMPTHLYARIGDHRASARLNERAARVDRSYIQKYGVSGMYPVMYYNHNMHFSAYSHAQAGEYRDALRMAQQVYASAAPVTKEMQMAELFTPTPLLVQVRFRRWNELLDAPEPPAYMAVTRGLWRFARGMAEAGLGRPDSAEAELRWLASAGQALRADAMVGFSSGKAVLAVAEELLGGRIAEARGRTDVAIEHLKRAVEKEDALPYDEPPDWYVHARESLGGACLRCGRPAEAERAFREDLERHPRNGRSLFGLMEALRAQRRTYEAGLVEREFRSAWKTADVRLAVADL